MNGIDNKRLKEKGLTILEALISTAIVGIGFVAVFQMVNYAVISIDVSGERTKSNYLTAMVAEDVIGDKYTKVANQNFYEWLVANKQPGGESWTMGACSTGSTSSTATTNVKDAKFRKWDNRFSRKRLKCKGVADEKSFKVFDICKSGCNYINTTATDYTNHDTIYLGRMEGNMNNGSKTKYLYFQIH